MSNRVIKFRAWDDNYEVGTDGSVWSVSFNNTGIRKQMKTYFDNDGYPYVFLHFGKRKKKMVHRMVAELFLIKPSTKHQVNHKNRIRNDNRLENLEWVTSQENTLHGWQNGRTYSKETKIRMRSLFVGENNPKSKLCKQYVEKIRRFRNEYGWTLEAIANDFKVSQSTISSIATGRTWK
jgi:DNA-binding XRE family transcriptional regulator